VANHYQSLRRGFNWLGTATAVAKLIDFGTILAVLLFLTKQQVGEASLVVAVGVVVEPMNVLGTGDALISAKAVSGTQLDSIFWFAISTSVLVGIIILFAAPWVAAAFGTAGMTAYFIAIAVKQPLVGAALIPVSLMNRNLEYERIAVTGVCATFAAAVTRLGLAIAGTGAWALVIGFSVHGLYMLIAAQVARPFSPRLRFRRRSISRLVRFGFGAAAADALQHLFKNADYLLIGWFYGASELAVYRVAFSIAMEPVVAAGTLINRTALPVFAKVSRVKEHLAEAFTWSSRRLAVMVSPLMVALILAAHPITQLIHDRHGQSYSAAALPLQLLAAAALLRVALELLYPVMIGSGHPGNAARLSGETLLVLSVGIIAIGYNFSAARGIIAVSALWLAVYPVLLIWAAHYLRRCWGIRATHLSRNLLPPAVAVCSLAVVVELIYLMPGIVNPVTRITVVAVVTALAYLGLFVYGRRGLM
jgi:O-antigen/teichoic acid export membrane protein